MENKNKIIISAICAFIVITIGTSYALLRSNVTSANPYTMNVGLLNITFKDNIHNLSLSNAYPMSDTDGMEQSDELIFTIKNTGELDALYNVYIEETSISPEFKTKIRYANSKDNGVTYSDIKTLSENKYIEQNGLLEQNGEVTYNVKCWLDESADNTYMNKVFTAKIVVESKQAHAVNVTYDYNYLENNVLDEYVYTDLNHIVTNVSNPSENEILKIQNLNDNGKEYTFSAAAYHYQDDVLSFSGIYFKRKKYLTVNQQYTLMFEIKASNNINNARICFESGIPQFFNLDTSWKKIITNVISIRESGTLIFYNWLSDLENRTLYVRNIQLAEGEYSNFVIKTLYGGNKLEVDAPEREDWTFIGWFTDPIYGEQVTNNTDVPQNDTTYYAHWRYNNYE